MVEQWEQQRLAKFIQRRGGTVTIRELMQSYAPLKNQRGKAEAALNALSAIAYGKWSLFSTTKKGGRPNAIFQIIALSTKPLNPAVTGLMNPNKTRRHNAKRCQFAKRQAIIYALANHESVESIRRNYRASRHTVLAIREQYLHEIEAAQARIKSAMETHYFELAHEAMDKIGRQIELERSPLRLLKIYDAMTDRMLALEAPVQKHPQPLSIKLAALRRAKRNELSVPSA